MLLAVLLVFALGNSADAFLLLRLTDVGVDAAFIPLLWAALHVVKALTSVWGGVMSDRVGRRAVIGAGWLIYASSTSASRVSTSVAALVGLLLFYGFYYGLSEGTEKALIADLAPAIAARHGLRHLQRGGGRRVAGGERSLRSGLEGGESGGGVRHGRRAGAGGHGAAVALVRRAPA